MDMVRRSRPRQRGFSSPSGRDARPRERVEMILIGRFKRGRTIRVRLTAQWLGAVRVG